MRLANIMKPYDARLQIQPWAPDALMSYERKDYLVC